MENLIKPHGGTLRHLICPAEEGEALKQASVGFSSIDLNERQLCQLELLMNGAYSPLTGYLDEANYHAVMDNLRLTDGTFWPMPVTLDVTEDFAETITTGDKVALRDEEGFMLAVLTVESLWKRDKAEESEKLLASGSAGVKALINGREAYCLGGPVEGIHLPVHRDYPDLRLTPDEMRQRFAELGWKRIIAFETSRALHRLDREWTLKVAGEEEANLLLHYASDVSKAVDREHYTGIRSLQALLAHYPPAMAQLNILPLALRRNNGRETLLRALVEKNYGCSHIVISGSDMTLFNRYAPELEIKALQAATMVYVESRACYMAADEVPPGTKTLSLSGAELNERLKEGRPVPEWFSYEEIIHELRKTHPPKSRQGFTLFFTGFSGSGKSTIANIVLVKLLEAGGRPVTLLDGDIVRKNLSSELNFSKEHRDINILRIGFVANEITKNGGIAICAPIAPYERVRKANRDLISSNGGYIEIHVSTPIEVCEKRDRKGLYAKARAGIITGMTGIDDPYEAPQKPEIRVDTTNMSPEEAANEILLYLEKEGYLL